MPHPSTAQTVKITAQPLPEKPFISLSEAITWLAFGTPMRADELINVLEFCDFEEAMLARQQVLSAVDSFLGAVVSEKIGLLGRYVSHTMVDDSQIPTKPIAAETFHDFRWFDALCDGLLRGRGLSPRYAPEGMDTAYDNKRRDAYHYVKVNRAELLAYATAAPHVGVGPAHDVHDKRASTRKTGRPPSDDEIRAKADEMKARGLGRDDIAKLLRREPGFENAGNAHVRVALKGHFKRGRPQNQDE